ncbi:unnamed protein product [Polarella glacialis]|uniref:Hexosyltransferase n=1 Tax=Polarella glacialis TaxID=89957 RepID=A0A813I6D5_POLGL|nr:unnamed protein product [Polarella glacialis]
MEAVLRTYGPDCDELRFFVATEQAELENDLMVDLHAAFHRAVIPDQDSFHRENSSQPAPSSANTIIKLLHMLRWAAEDHVRRHGPQEQWWFCRLERDTFFLPENFRLLVASARLDAKDAHYLGAREFTDVARVGLVFNDGGPGVCLSGGALLRLHAVLVQAPTLPGDQLPDFQSCAFAAGHREDIMLAACLRQVVCNVRASKASTPGTFGPAGRICTCSAPMSMNSGLWTLPAPSTPSRTSQCLTTHGHS